MTAIRYTSRPSPSFFPPPMDRSASEGSGAGGRDGLPNCIGGGAEFVMKSAKIYGNCISTLSPSGGNKNEAENILKTKGRKRWFLKNEVENILKTSQLAKTAGGRNSSDILSCQADGCAGRIR